MKSGVLLIGLGTLLLFGGGGWLIIELWQGGSLWDELTSGLPVYQQLFLGTGLGLLSAWLALQVIFSKFFKEHRRHYFRMISSTIPLSWSVIIFLSLCAGLGEEIFFRAGLQPMLGLWLTSFVFVALHGYFSLRSLNMNVYGLLMLLVIAGFGILYTRAGLISAVVAHTVFDLIIFRSIMINTVRLKPPSEAGDDSPLHAEV